MVQLHDITDKPTGWIQLVKSLVRVVPIEHPMGPSVIMLLLDDSPLPTKDSVLEVRLNRFFFNLGSLKYYFCTFLGS